MNSGLDPTIAAAIEPELPALADEIVAAIQREVPEYAGPLRGEFGRGIRGGVEQALRRFIAAGTSDESGADDVYRALGRGEHRARRSLDALQSAYRIGARVAWRRLSRVAAAAGAPIESQHDFAETIFAYIDQLAAESVEGYADAQAAQAEDLQRRREELLALLLSPSAEEDALLAAATEAKWTIPRRVAFVATAPDEAGRVARRLSGDPLHGEVAGQAAIAVPDPTHLLRELEVAARRYRTSLGLGPVVAVGDAPRSLRWAVLARELAGEDSVVSAEEQLPALALSTAPDVLAALRERALAPLGAETPRSRERLEQTLRSWLRHRGAQATVAAELGVHPQTVRYRVRRLRELFGSALEDPDGRFALELALRSGA